MPKTAGLPPYSAALPPIAQQTARNILFNGLGAVLPDDSARSARVVLVETEYLPVPLDWLVAVMRADKRLAPGAYAPGIWDCDDYCIYLRCLAAIKAREAGMAVAPAVGYLVTEVHVMNLCIDAANRLMLVDTQSDDRATTSDPTMFREFLEARASLPVLSVLL